MLATVTVCAMSVPLQLERDFGNPARFYSAISQRQKKNPVFLARLLRPRPNKERSLSKFLNVEIAGVHPASNGHLIVALISSSRQSVNKGSNPVTLSVISHKKIPLEKNENVNRLLQLPISPLVSSAVRDLDLLLIIAFHPLLPDNVIPLIDAIKTHLIQVFANSHCPRTDSEMDPTAIHICTLDITCKLASLEKRTSKKNVTNRRWMWPVLSKRQEITLFAQPRIDLIRPTGPPTGSLLHANIEVKWSSFEQPIEEVESWIHANSNSSSSSSSNSDPNAHPSDRNLTSLQSPGHKLPDSGKKYLVYHYMYKDPETQLFHAKKEVIDSVECIWCGSFFGQYCKRSNKRNRDSPKKLEKKREFNCNSTSDSTRRSIEHLMFHLRNCHFHFEYHPMRDQEGNLFIFMMRDRSQDLSVDSLIEERRKPFYWFHTRRGKDRKSFHQDLAIIRIPPTTLQPRNKLKEKADTVTKDTQLVATRQYYHPRTGLPIVNEELGHESEDECDNRWDLMMANQALDEFEDIGYEEKVFMKLWNTHIASFPPYGDGYLPIVCERFVRKFASRIVDEHLRYHCLFHFLVMHDFGLLRSDEVQYYMTIIDRQVKEKKDEEESINEL